MKQLLLFSFLILTFTTAFTQKNYFPPAGSWEKRDALQAGFDTAKLNAAVRFAIANETKKPRDLKATQQIDFGSEPFSEPVGPLIDRGDPTGLIIYKGYIIAEWGNPSAVEITNSVTKSFLSSVIGIAVDRGIIKSVNDTVANYLSPIELYDPQSKDYPKVITPFAGEHNSRLTWDVMLRQTSDWEGALWGKPDWADRPDKDSTKWLNRVRNKPGAVFEYNDVRVNALALAATMVWRKPLPQVLKTEIMQQIGASNSWQWHGYRNSWIVLDGEPVQSVSGGGHWGGGLFINSYDMARFGLLTLHKGNWNGKQIISEQWIKQATTPTAANPGYGYMNFFLPDKDLPDASPGSVTHEGNGANIIYVDPSHGLVIVSRWIQNDAIDSLIKQVLASIK